MNNRVRNICFIKSRPIGRYYEAARLFKKAMVKEKILNRDSGFGSSDVKGIFIEVNDIIVGMALYDCRHSTTECTINFVYIEPGFRRNGLGEKLLKEVEDDLRQSGIRRVYLHSITSEMDALAEKQGFAAPTQCMTKNLIL